MVGATLSTAVLMTADSTSVYDGASLPQVLLILLTAAAASFSNLQLGVRAAAWRTRGALLAVLIGWLLLSALSATWQANGRAAWNGFWHVLALILFGGLVRQLCSSPALARAVVQLLFISAVFLSAHGIHQVFISMPESRAHYALDPEGTLAELELDAPPGSALRAQYEQRLNSSEPLATFALTNSLAVVLSGALIALSLWIARQLGEPHRQHVQLVIASVMWALIVSVWLMTKSRAAYLSVFVIAAVTVGTWWLKRRRTSSSLIQNAFQQRWFTPAVLVAIGCFVTLVVLLSRDSLVLTEAPKSILYRLEYWQAASRMILDHPWIGVGLGNFQSYYPRYKLPAASEIVADPHNWLFDIAATCSVPVLVLVAFALAMLLLRSWTSLTQQWFSSNQPSSVQAQLSQGEDMRLSGKAQRSNRKSPNGALTEDDRLVRALLIGAAAGWMLTAALQWMMHEAIDLEAASLAVLTALVCISFFNRGAQLNDATVRGAALAAAATMLMCLLATGSWQASGLALPLAAWLGICSPPLTRPKPQQTKTSNDTKQRFVMRGLAICLLVAFLFQTWRPVNVSWAQMQAALAARNQGDYSTAEQAARRSIEADPIDPMPRRLLVQVEAMQAERGFGEPTRELEFVVERAQAAIDSFLKCDPVPAENWAFAAETLIALAAAQEESAAASPSVHQSHAEDAASAQVQLKPNAVELLKRADEYLQAAVERYPSSVALHAQRAVVLRLIGALDASRQARETAFALSDASPHADRKLDMQLVWLPPALTKFPEPAVVRPSPGSTRAKAEPLLEFLRKN